MCVIEPLLFITKGGRCMVQKDQYHPYVIILIDEQSLRECRKFVTTFHNVLVKAIFS